MTSHDLVFAHTYGYTVPSSKQSGDGHYIYYSTREIEVKLSFQLWFTFFTELELLETDEADWPVLIM